MNIFVLHTNPEKAAQMLCDKHVVKMILETAQILSTVAQRGYKPTHAKHPCTLWAKESIQNWNWLCEHGIAMGKEYTARYGKVHKSIDVIQDLIDNPPDLPNKGLTPFAQAMPDDYKCNDAVSAYRKYYINDKKDIAVWKYSETPDWYLKAA